MDAERRFFEVRAAPVEVAGERILTGLAVPYGAVAILPRGRRERFEAGAARSSGEALLNLQHAPTILLAREPDGLTFEQSDAGLRFRAVLADTQDAADAVKLVEARVIRGVSVEFRSVRERFDMSGVRSLQDALVSGLALAARPIYQGTTVEVVEARMLEAPVGWPSRRRVWL